jgi:hypothetical protein
VDTLDTAAGYGSSETCLGTVGVANWHVVTKLPGLPSDVGPMAFGSSLPGVERIVVGVDSMLQLEEILTASAAEATAVPEDLSSSDRDLIEPLRWKLQ